MQLSIQAHKENLYPLGGILIRGSHPETWIREIDRMGFDLDQTTCFALPNTSLNSTWGCLVVPKTCHVERLDLGKNEACQLIHQLLFIPEKARLFPSISIEEIDHLLISKKHILHPDFGMVELFEPIDWGQLIAPLEEVNIQVKQPASSVFVPTQIKTFQVYALSPEELLEQLEKNSFPDYEKLDNKPLSPAEKARLFLLKKLFQKHKDGAQDSSSKKPLLGKLASLRNMLTGKESEEWTEALQQEYEALERRNQKQLDKLMDLLKNNPEEALKYAIPLDESGAGRGGDAAFGGTWNLSQRWADFGLFGNSGSFGGSGGGSIFDNEGFYQLQAQYHKTAEALIQEGKFRKAAFVYMKLLKQYRLAAETLEKGKIYQEAASIYLKYCDDKEKAAECYRKGNMPKKAIELYKDIKKYELVGDIYAEMQQQEEAFIYYNKVIEGHCKLDAYMKASLLCKNKMHDVARSQTFLLEGWRKRLDAFNCLNNYFHNIPDLKVLKSEIDYIYAEEVDDKNRATFLRVIKHEFQKDNDLAPHIREIAYQIIAKEIKRNPMLSAELKIYNKHDKMLNKDVLRYRLGLNKKRK